MSRPIFARKLMSTYCAEVLPSGDGSGGPDHGGPLPAWAGSSVRSDVKALLIREEIEGFVLCRLAGLGEPLGDTQHDTLDEAMSQANSEYELSAWRFCPDGVDPLQYIRGRSESGAL